MIVHIELYISRNLSECINPTFNKSQAIKFTRSESTFNLSVSSYIFLIILFTVTRNYTERIHTNLGSVKY